MDHDDCEHSSCTAKSANSSVCQTLSEMDWERGLWCAAFNGDMDRVRLLIDKSRNIKETVNAPDNAGYTALHYAARNGYVDICKILLNNGADINAHTKSGKATPLHKAAAAGKKSTINFLIQNGACLDMQDVDGQTALHKAVQNKNIDLVDILLKACPRLASIKDFKGHCATDFKSNTEDAEEINLRLPGLTLFASAGRVIVYLPSNVTSSEIER